MPIDLGSLDLTPEWSKTTPGSQLPPKKDKPHQKPSTPLVRRSFSEGGKGDGIVRVGRETKGRKGSGVTVITGIPSHPEGLEKLAKQFKQQCGTGGTVKNGVIEIQGDHRDLLVKELSALGYTVKKAGG
ncbi:MAG: stress response translation initiation inhibitor YciH [Kiritimatiellaceae bacterium]|nr:stress response translation initiation inhibitor YciH [Kiritimatiellaceae bacterium]